MINLDNINQKKTDIMAALSAAIKSNDTAALQKSMNDWQDFLTESITAEANGDRKSTRLNSSHPK